MPTTFITVKEAALRTGKSISSIRRIIYPILKNDQHPDRNQIEPNVEDARRLRADGTSFPWRLSEDLLRRAVPDTTHSGSHSADSPHRSSPGDAQTELLAMLRRELDTKNQQIRQQSELLAQLGERIRESNILIGTLQKHLSLTDGRDQPMTEPIKSNPSPTPKPEKGSGRAKKPAKEHRGFFSLFRSKK